MTNTLLGLEMVSSSELARIANVAPATLAKRVESGVVTPDAVLRYGGREVGLYLESRVPSLVAFIKNQNEGNEVC